MRQFIKDLFISASNGCLGRSIILVIVVSGVGYVGFNYVASIDADSEVFKSITAVIAFIAIFITIFGIVGLLVYLPTILEWLSHQKEAKIRELELKKEILELETQKESDQENNNDHDE